eukprot:9873902-Prorocentrum_lima.AAC.1
MVFAQTLVPLLGGGGTESACLLGYWHYCGWLLDSGVVVWWRSRGRRQRVVGGGMGRWVCKMVLEVLNFC